MELERRRLTAEMIVPDTGESVRTEIEVRIDPLTGHSSRILPDRGLMPANEFDLEAFARESREHCPFCPERIEALTPRLAPAIDQRGRITRGEAILFPNLHAYSSHSCVSVYSSRLHYLPRGRIDERLMGDNLWTQAAYARAVMLAEPESRWASINANHMLPSGSSLFHPHLQIRPAGVSRERRAAVRGPTKVDAWDDFPSVSGSTFLRGGTAGASRCWGDGSFQRRRVLGCRGRVGSIWPRSRSMSHDAW
jgi:hypothetical protein